MKKPRKLIAIDAAMMFGTLDDLVSSCRLIYLVQTQDLQPEHELQCNTQ